MRRSKKIATMLATIMAILLAACADDTSESSVDGEALYAMPHTDGNTFACATCHALSEPAADGITRPGHPIGDAANRASFKGGQLSSLREAVNTCRVDWMGAPAYEANDDRWIALESYLQTEAGQAAAPPIALQIVDAPADLTGGDEMEGQAVFNRTCVVCHGSNAVGTERAPSIAGTTLSDDFIATKIRRSGNGSSAIYPGLTFGRMPFWQADRLSDGELRDIVAFLAASEVVVPPPPPAGSDLSQAGSQSGCGATHPAIGQTLTFATNAHSVAGTATIVDDCTIQFDNFSFDGGGINIRIYGGSGGNYANGPNLSINLLGSAFNGEEAMLRLPAGVTLDDFDGLSVWCVPVGVSFGDGLFQ